MTEKIYLFIPQASKLDIIMVKSRTLDDALPLALRKLHETDNAGANLTYVKAVELERVIDELSLPRINMVVAPEAESKTPKATYEQLAQLLRDNGYVVEKAQQG